MDGAFNVGPGIEHEIMACPCGGSPLSMTPIAATIA